MIENKTIVYGNKLIADFMGAEFERKKDYFDTSRMLEYYYFEGNPSIKYNKTDKKPRCQYTPESLLYLWSWDWLMPVIDEVESTHHEFHGYFGVHIYSNNCSIQGTKLNLQTEHHAYFNDITLEHKLESVWYAVVQFIEWYNKQKEDGEIFERKQ